MKRKKIKVPLYDFVIVLIEIENKEDVDLVRKDLKWIKAKKEHIVDELQAIEDGRYNGGMTYTNIGKKAFLILINRTTSKRKRFEVIGHEKRHIEDHIVEHCQIDDIEAVAYLAGFLTEKLLID